MLGGLSDLSVVIFNIIDTDPVVMRPNCEVSTIRRVRHNLDPLLAVVLVVQDVVDIFDRCTDVKLTVVGTDGDMSVAWVD